MTGTKEVSTYLERLVTEAKVPGVQYLVTGPSGVIFEYATGWADLGESRPMNLATTLMAYSMSKTITAAAVLQLADLGRLRLDDPASSYVDCPPYDSRITVRQLLTHTAGVPNPIPLRWAHLVADHADFDETAALLKQLEANARLSSSPGEKYRYSNLGYWLLGPIIARAGGKPFSAYVTEHVLSPLGALPELGYSVSTAAPHATGYLEKYSFLNVVKRLVMDQDLIGDYQGRWLEINGHYVDGPAFGGLVGNARGFGKFLQDQLRTQSVLFGDRTRELFYEPAHTLDATEVAMTPGWHIETLEGVRYFFKEGGGGGFHCMMRVYRDRGIGTVVLTNATAFNVGNTLDVLDGQFL